MMAEKDGYQISNYSVKAEIVRTDSVPMKFESMHIIFDFEGEFDATKAKRYIGASLESYCTTVNSIRDSVKVSYTIIHNGETIAQREELISMSVPIEDGFGGACCS
jgi:putative redox protein